MTFEEFSKANRESRIGERRIQC